MRSFFFTLVGIAAAAFGVSGCGQEEPPIKIAISAWAGVEPVELAAQLGFFEKRGVDVRVVRFSAYTDSIEALRDGKADVGMHTLDDVIRYTAGGKDVRVVLVTDHSYGGDGIVARPGIDSVSDLKGKTVGVEIGTVGHFSLLKALEAAGLSEQDIKIVSIPAWEIKEGFLAGNMDAGVTWEPYLSSSAQESGGKVVITSREYPYTIFTTMAVSAEIADKRKKDVENIVAAYFEAVEYMKANSAEAFRIMGAAEGVSAGEFEAHAEGLRYLDVRDNADLLAPETGTLRRTAMEIATFLKDKGIIEKVPNIEKLLNAQFVTDLARDGR